ncbi:MAG TPA: DUF427 domain-containing protein [Sandaracinaceae bacterium LLY-WYZ-13_1]|nr:DUF427 domain-containing protein [Sandaracinaceae bacterium LLY-WYZ-13_1]
MSDGTPHEKLPRWAELGRRGWTNTGARRPDFAETPGPGQESVWDYPRPPALVADDRLVRVELGGEGIAESRRTLRILETSHPPTFYIPREDVKMERFTRVGVGSRCEWKGEATYWDVRAGGREVRRGAWSYESPFDELAAIAGHLCFYADRFDCFVDGARVEPQPGGFYGGWITPELVGPFKGGPGSAGW